MLKLRLEKAVNGSIITLIWLMEGRPEISRSAIFNDIRESCECFKRLSEIMDNGKMTIKEFVAICSEYK